MSKRKSKAKAKTADAGDTVPVPKSDLANLESIRGKAAELEVAEKELEKAVEAHKAAKAERDDIRESLVVLCKGQDLGGPLVELSEADGWKRVPLADVIGAQFSEQVMDRASGIIARPTLGHFCAFLMDHPLTDLRGFGPAKADKVLDRLYSWWMQHPQWQPPKSMPRPMEVSS